MNSLYRDCPTCGGSGDITTGNGFHDQCPDCSAYGVIKVEQRQLEWLAEYLNEKANDGPLDAGLILAGLSQAVKADDEGDF